MKLRSALTMAVAALLLVAPAGSRAKIPEDKIKIGILQDQPEPVGMETGNGGVVAAQLAASDFGKEYLNGDGEILAGVTAGTDDAVLAQVRDWLDKEHVAAILSSAGPLIDRAIAPMVAQRHRTLLVTSNEAGGESRLCSPNVVVWGDGPSTRARALAQALVPRGTKHWFVLTDRSPTGLADREALDKGVAAEGGEIAGAIDDVDGAAALGKAQGRISAAEPQAVVLTQSDGDLVDLIRASHAMALPFQATFVAPNARLADIDQAGPAAAQGLVVVTPFYWDANADTRRFAQRWDDRMPGARVTSNAAEIYAATLSFLHAAKAVDDVDAEKVLAELRRAPIKGTLFGDVTVRRDGRVVHDVGVYRVKRPGEIQQRWAYYDRLAMVRGAAAVPPAACQTQPGADAQDGSRPAGAVP
jgi:branched-chain amino acid transport system substrate-binding protein